MPDEPAPRIGVVRWRGSQQFRGQEVELRGDGSSLMVALEPHPRVQIGQQFIAQASEVTWDA